ncbi:MAG: sigma-70 family RNA polymerase sigma factor [Planctomycetes bacterium]|nr:sigma-70 family RNA polymerase sigma factor [Planctomycetota bacterium]
MGQFVYHAQVPDESPDDLTTLLEAAHGGCARSAERALEMVWAQLRQLAARQLDHEQHATLEPTALVDEVWFKLAGEGAPRYESRKHFFHTAARCMRRMLVDRARAASRQKRGGGQALLTLDSHQLSPERQSEDLLALDEAMTRLERRDPRKHEVVLLRFFAGLTVEETAKCLEVSAATVKDDWSFARAWLQAEIEKR